MLRIFKMLISIFLIFPFVANAQRSELFEKKSKVESLITERMRSIISTSLEPTAFDVSVSVTLSEIKPPAPKEDQADSDGKKTPEDLHMGLINAEELIRNYEQEINKLRIEKESLDQSKKETQYEVKQLTVAVGLQEELGDEYVKEFKSWLSAKIKTEFGSIGKVIVNKIKLRPLKEKQSQPQKILDLLKDFQPALSTILAILGLILIALLLRGGRKDEEKKDELSLKMNSPLMTAGKGGGDSEQKSLLTKTDPSDIEKWQQVAIKIHHLILASKLDINRIISNWLDLGESGFEKTTAVLDALLDPKLESSIVQNIKIPDQYKGKVSTALQKMRETAYNSRTAILEGSYWDLLSVHALGEQWLKKPFSYMPAYSEESIKSALDKLSEIESTVALLSMPKEKRAGIVRLFDDEQKRNLIQRSLKLTSISETQINSVSDKLNLELQKTSGAVSALPIGSVLPDFLDTVPVMDEIKYIREMLTTSPAEIETLKSIWPSVAFLPDWTEESFKLLCQRCSPDELETIILNFSELKDAVIKNVSPKVAEMIEDSLRIVNRLDTETQEKNLSSVKFRIQGLIEARTLNLKSLYRGSADSNLAAA